MSQVEKVVIVAFDGLRPDMIAGRMSTLEAFIGDNLWFSNARSVFPSLTRVCTTSVSTGAWPGKHGIVNNEFHVAQDLTGPMIDTAKISDIQSLGDRTGSIVTCNTLSQQLSAAGLSMTALHCGSPGSGMLINHSVKEDDQRTLSIIGEQATLTPEAVSPMIKACGPLPSRDVPKLAISAYIGKVATEFVLGQQQSDVTVLWMPEPDSSYHHYGLHTDETAQAMNAADECFAQILTAIEAGAYSDKTAVVVMSDHGQIATSALIDLAGDLRADGFRVGKTPGDDIDILMTGGNVGELRPMTMDNGLITELGHWLMAKDYIGMVFADPDIVSGAISPQTVHQTHDRSADLWFVMRSDSSNGPGGLPGIGVYTGGVALGGGMHGGLNPYEMNTLLGFSTPDGRKSEVDNTPTSLIDIAPTILNLLGLEIDNGGRILPLYEAEQEQAVEEILTGKYKGFCQQLKRSSIAGRCYLIEGGRG